jgi:hypothetical protein
LELIDCDEGTQLWGAQFKEAYGDVLARPEDLADKISHQLLRVLSASRGLVDSKRSEHAA